GPRGLHRVLDAAPPGRGEQVRAVEARVRSDGCGSRRRDEQPHRSARASHRPDRGGAGVLRRLSPPARGDRPRGTRAGGRIPMTENTTADARVRTSVTRKLVRNPLLWGVVLLLAAIVFTVAGDDLSFFPFLLMLVGGWCFGFAFVNA